MLNTVHQGSSLHFFVTFLVLFSAPTQVLANRDTDLRIEQRDALNSRKTENQLIKEELEKDKQASLTIDGEIYLIGDTLDELGPALHIAVKLKKWGDAAALLARYQALEGSDPMLIDYASGALARINGEYDRADFHYRSMLTTQPDFLPAQLELARVLFENQKNRESHTLFHSIYERLPVNEPRAEGVRKTIESFLSALDYREEWQGSISFGPTYNDNLNQSSGHYQCLLKFVDGDCFIERKVPEKISASGLDYTLSANKRTSLSDHHGFKFKTTLYGTRYQNNKIFNEQTLNIAMGYNYQTARYQFDLLPQFEYRSFSDKAYYAAGGLKVDQLYNLTPKSAVKLDLEGEYQDYRQRELHYLSDWQWSAYLTYWHQVPHNWLLFGGLDWTQKENQQSVHEYHLWGGRLGVNKRLDSPDIDLTLFSALRQRIYGSYSAMLGNRRDDTELSVTLVSAFPALWKGIQPVLEVDYSKTNSNIDWLYTYDKHQFTLKFEKRF